MAGFSWVLPQKLAGLPRPGATGDLQGDLAFLQASGITLLVSLTEVPVPQADLARVGMEGLHLPVRDFHAPTLDQLQVFTDRAHGVIASGGRVGVHCAAGLGRTGTFLAAYLVTEGQTADGAMAQVRKLRPGSIEMDAQEQAVRDFQASRGQ